MKNFDWNEFKMGNMVVYCSTEERTEDFLEKCSKMDISISEIQKNHNNYKGNNYFIYDKKNSNNPFSSEYLRITKYDNQEEIIRWKISNEYEEEININNNIEEEININNNIEEEINRYILYNDFEELFLELNKSQINLINFLIEKGIVDKNDVVELDNVEYKTI